MGRILRERPAPNRGQLVRSHVDDHAGAGSAASWPLESSYLEAQAPFGPKRHVGQQLGLRLSGGRSQLETLEQRRGDQRAEAGGGEVLVGGFTASRAY
jgi:hypothetical protein